jgi:hypothetical protein
MSHDSRNLRALSAVHSVQQKPSSLKFCTSRYGSDVMYIIIRVILLSSYLCMSVNKEIKNY